MLKKRHYFFPEKQTIQITFMALSCAVLVPAIAISAENSGFDGLQFYPLNSAQSVHGVTPSTDMDASTGVSNPELTQAVQAFFSRQNSGTSLKQMQKGNGKTVMKAPSQRILAKNAIPPELKIEFNKKTGVPRQISLQNKMQQKNSYVQKAAYYYPLGKARDKETVKLFLKSKKGVFQLKDPVAELKLAKFSEDKYGRRHIRYKQQYKGLEIWPAELNIHLDVGGNVELVNGTSIPTPIKMATTPVWDLEDAVAAARVQIPNGESATVASSDLIIYGPGSKAPRLAWKLNLKGGTFSDWLVVIDAMNGVALMSLNNIQEIDAAGSSVDLHNVGQNFRVWQEAIGEYYMIDTSKKSYVATSNPPSPTETKGAIIILDSQNQPANPMNDPIKGYQVKATNPDVWPVKDTVSAMYGLSKTYDYFETVHQRNSIDGQGMSVVAMVRVGSNFANAFWNGQAMFFGDADTYAGALDVTAHELTHGVTEKTAHLIYKDQAGALNEAFSDIFGENVESWVTGGKQDWLLGGSLSKVFRNMKDPGSIDIGYNLGAYPSKMSEFINTQMDNGGVHLNSSIINHAYYLLAEGLNGAIGIQKAEKIFYQVLTQYLVQNSQFIDARLAAIAVAKKLYGNGSVEAEKVAEAFNAVEIIPDAPTPEPPPFPEVKGEDSLIFVYYDPAAGYTKLGRRETALGDPNTGWYLSTYDAKVQRPAVSGDGSHVIFVDNYNDLCWINTNANLNTNEECSGSGANGFQGWVHSVAMSPDQNRYAFVFLDSINGNLSSKINIYNQTTQQWQEYSLGAPAIDGNGSIRVLYADSMDFTANSEYLVYDAYNAITLADGTKFGAWSIYALQLATNQVFTVVPPMPGYDFGNPALSQTTHNFITFEGVEHSSGLSAVFAMNLNNGKYSTIATNSSGINFSLAPSYTGDDSAIVFSYPTLALSSPYATNTGYALIKQGLAADRITPNDVPAIYIGEGTMGVVYRRGTFVKPVAAIKATPSNVQYKDKVNMNKTVSDLVTISNNGSSDLKITSIAITGANAAEFALQTNCVGQTLPGTGSCKVTVFFTPQDESPKTAMLTVGSDDPKQPLLDIPLTTGVNKAGYFPWSMFFPAIQSQYKK